MDDNWRIAIGYFCVALVLIAVFIGAAWIMSPQEFTFNIEMDNNTKEAVESIKYPIINQNITEIKGGCGRICYDGNCPNWNCENKSNSGLLWKSCSEGIKELHDKNIYGSAFEIDCNEPLFADVATGEGVGK